MKSKIGLIALTFLLVFGIPFWHAQAQTQHSITVTYSASSTSGVLYLISRSTSSTGAFTTLNPSGTAALTYTDTTGTGGTTYFYEVTVTCTGGTCPAGISGNSVASAPSAGTLFLGSPAPVGAPPVATSN